MSEQLMYGFTSDNDEAVQGKKGFNGGEFGLNEGFLTGFEYIEKTSKGGNPYQGLEITLKIKDSEVRTLFFPIEGSIKDGDDTIEPSDPRWKDLAIGKMKEYGAIITHTLKSLGVVEETIKTVMNTPSTSYKEWINKAVGLLPAGFESRPLHIFLEYQFTLKPDAKKTFPVMPKNMKGGYFLAPAVGNVKDWAEIKEWVEKDKDGNDVNKEGLTYVNPNGEKHIFKRDKNFMESNKAVQQVKGEEQNSNFTPPVNPASSGNTAADWGSNT